MGLMAGPKVDLSEGSRVDNHSEGSKVDNTSERVES